MINTPGINFISVVPGANVDAVFKGLQLSASQMPMQPLGNKEAERTLINDAEEINRTQRMIELGSKVFETQKTDTDKDAESMPWADIMQQLGLTYTGDDEEDYNAITDEIQFQIDNAPSQYDLNYYEWLLEHTEKIFDEKNDIYAHSADYVNAFAGAEQLAELNTMRIQQIS